MAADPAERVRQIIAAGRYMTLATADADGRPWATPVWYAPVGTHAFLWLSDPDVRHSRNIAARQAVALVIFDTAADPGATEAVYVDAVAERVPASDLDDALAHYDRHSTAQGLPAWTKDDVTGTAGVRLYRARATTHHYGADGKRTQVRLSSDATHTDRAYAQRDDVA